MSFDVGGEGGDWYFGVVKFVLEIFNGVKIN